MNVMIIVMKEKLNPFIIFRVNLTHFDCQAVGNTSSSVIFFLIFYDFFSFRGMNMYVKSRNTDVF